MDIPNDLLNQVRDGRVDLFLGAGASRTALTADGRGCPTTIQLGHLLSDEFLGGYIRDGQLSQIAEYAISERDLGSVQAFIREQFLHLVPTDGHKLLPRFVWHGLATTNYDLLIEDAYTQTRERLQEPRPMIEDRDRVDDNLRDPRNVLLLKLHGCITRITNEHCPLILTPDQYLEHRRSRSRLFGILKEWGAEHPLIFLGHSVQDPDIRAVLLELSELGEYRPRYFIVAPDVDSVAVRFWESKKITVLGGTFEEFFRTLDAGIPATFRSLASIGPPAGRHPIERYSRTKTPLTSSTTQFLAIDVEYVNGISATAHVDPRDFYKGYTGGFAAIDQGLDVRRKISDELALDYLIRDQDEPTTGPEVVLIKAHAGAGKSVILHRLAWSGAHEYECICLFTKSQGSLSAAPLQELIRSLRRRIYLFVDDAADRSRELEALLKRIGPEGDYLTIIIAERINEWNIQGQAAAPFITDEYELKYLVPAEIDALLALLEQHGALGTRLERLNLDERRNELSEHAGRQLLVALHEATLGQPFETILLNEFNHITPFEAQRLYLTFCVLNRLNVPVRAGLVARVHGIPYEDFKTKFFAPLEHVVFAQIDDITRDYHYRARHPHIADIVFLKALKTAEERFDCYIRCLKALNVAYSVDWKAFWQMVRARNLSELFPDQQMVQAVFAAARETVGEDPHLLHQMGIHEMNRPGGDLAEASRLLNRAATLAPYDSTIKHSISESKLRAAERSTIPLEKTKLLREAADISAGLLRGEKTDSYAHHTLVKIEIQELEDGLIAGAPQAEIEVLVRDAENRLFEAQQEFPGDPYLLADESRLARILKDDMRATAALSRAFDANPRNAFIASRLAWQLSGSGQTEKALSILRRALDANGGDKRLHYTYARLLMETNPGDGDDIAYHLLRAFTEGDNSYEAQLLYGRQLFLNNRLDDSRALFRRLSAVRVAPETKNRLLHPMLDRRFEGRMARPQGSFGFIMRDGPGDSIYVHATNVPADVWEILTIGVRVRFSIAFSLRGANASDLEII
jgi:cold shock CspA family protein/Flp pilus assembly protein TadD